MSRLVFKDNITTGGTLDPGQTLQLGGFIMTACLATKPTMASRVIKNRLHVDSKKMDLTELSSLNELLDRIAALGSLQTTIGLGLNPIGEKSNLRRSPTR